MTLEMGKPINAAVQDSASPTTPIVSNGSVEDKNYFSRSRASSLTFCLTKGVHPARPRDGGSFNPIRLAHSITPIRPESTASASCDGARTLAGTMHIRRAPIAFGRTSTVKSFLFRGVGFANESIQCSHIPNRIAAFSLV